jgi:hypothetical protein
MRARKSIMTYAVGAVLMLGLGYLCFELGRYESGYSVLERRRETAALKELLEDEQAISEELKRQIAIFETSREIDRETYARVKADLSELQARIQEQEEELVFYRGIVSPQDGVAGLRIQSLEVVPADAERHYLLRLVLVQAIVHSRRAAGTVKLRFEGVRDGQPASLGLDELVLRADAAGKARGSHDIPYAFRYFQGLECELVLPVGFEPERIEVEILPTEPKGERVAQTFEWSAVGA